MTRLITRSVGTIGSAMLPGSASVLDWPSGQLVPCDPSTCYDATPPAANGTQAFFNRAIYGGDGFVMYAINRYAPEDFVRAMCAYTTLDTPEMQVLKVSV